MGNSLVKKIAEALGISEAELKKLLNLQPAEERLINRIGTGKPIQNDECRPRSVNLQIAQVETRRRKVVPKKKKKIATKKASKKIPNTKLKSSKKRKKKT